MSASGPLMKTLVLAADRHPSMLRQTAAKRMETGVKMGTATHSRADAPLRQ
jgi:hypothetical protein